MERRVRSYRALRDAGYSDLTTVRREDVAAEFNHRQFAVVDYLREESADSIRDLARELGFDEEDISEDLQLLSRLEVVTCETDGRAKVPRPKREHVSVEPLV
ncbi:transcriptional regulator [Halobaculum sp. MBLA0143]|uniref:HVO_A0114 family putative DNA-binding protein n=1 Tax=Halobaculum sp. MBLA0143 TaxID=3079933 RepID=UPI003525CFA2